MTLGEQWLTFFWMGGCGCLMGVFYDSLREIRCQWGIANRWLPLFDSLFWALSLLLVGAVLQFVSHGVFRWHVFPGLIAGGWLYFTLFTRPVRSGLRQLYRRIAGLILGMIRIVQMLIFQPLIFIGKGLSRFGYLLFRFVAGILSGIAKIFKRKRSP